MCVPPAVKMAPGAPRAGAPVCRSPVPRCDSPHQQSSPPAPTGTDATPAPLCELCNPDPRACARVCVCEDLMCERVGVMQQRGRDSTCPHAPQLNACSSPTTKEREGVRWNGMALNAHSLLRVDMLTAHVSLLV